MSTNPNLERRIITWKDADQNLCALAAYLLNEASMTIRTNSNTARPSYPSYDGPIPAGYAEEPGSWRSIFATLLPFNWETMRPAPPPDGNDPDPWANVPNANDLFEEGDTSIIDLILDGKPAYQNYIEASAADSASPAPQCWYCFQNLIRQRLKQARRELKKNLFGKGDPKSSWKQQSRNLVKRQAKSKFGRHKER